MPVVGISEDFETRQGEWTTNEGRNYTRIFRVQTNSMYDGPKVAIAAIGVNRGDAYRPYYGGVNQNEWDLNAYAHRISAVPDADLWWKVTVEYGPYSALFAGGGPTQNPILMPIDVSWNMSSHEIIADKDLDGNAVVNSAGDPFDPPLVEDEKRRTLTVVRNESTYDQTIDQAYAGSVNSDYFAGYPALMVKCLSIVPKSVFHQDIGWYYQRTYEFECLNPTLPWNANGYRRTVIDQGLRQLTDSGKKVHISFRGIPATEPVLLNAAGRTLPLSSSPHYLIYQTKPELPFEIFNFEQAALIGQRTGFDFAFGNQGA